MVHSEIAMSRCAERVHIAEIPVAVDEGKAFADNSAVPSEIARPGTIILEQPSGDVGGSGTLLEMSTRSTL